jgi:hypothetical protein
MMVSVKGQQCPPQVFIGPAGRVKGLAYNSRNSSSGFVTLELDVQSWFQYSCGHHMSSFVQLAG